MTRKDYVLLAHAFYMTRPATEGHRDYDAVRLAQWRTDRDKVADELAADNPRFDRPRFERASFFGQH